MVSDSPSCSKSNRGSRTSNANGVGGGWLVGRHRGT